MKPTVFRSKVAWVFGWAWIVFALLNAWDLAVRGTMPSALIAAAVLGINILGRVLARETHRP